jgi:hypothetical protein
VQQQHERKFQMTNKRRLWSLSGLASESGRNFRTISKALANIKPDGKIAGKPAWFMSSCIVALDEHVARTARMPTRAAPERFDPVVEAKIAKIEESGRSVDALLRRLRAEQNIERRRAIIEAGVGRVVGEHERAIMATVGDNAHSPLRLVFVEKMMGDLVAEITTLCEWRVAPQ